MRIRRRGLIYWLWPAVVMAIASVGPASAQAERREINVLNAGDQPREVLRYAPRPNSSQTLDVQMRQKTSTRMGGKETSMPAMPGMQFQYTIIIDHVSGAGDITYTMTATDVTVEKVDPQAATQMLETYRKHVASVKGAKAEVTIDGRGLLTGPPKITMPAGADARMAQTVSQQFTRVALPLPVEPVGKGAMWTIREQRDAGGMQVTELMTVTLKDLQSGALELKFEVTGEVSASQTAPSRMNVRIAGEGAGGISLTKVGPVQTALTMITTMTMDAGQEPMTSQSTIGLIMKTVE